VRGKRVAERKKEGEEKRKVKSSRAQNSNFHAEQKEEEREEKREEKRREARKKKK
jgi:hypothetical protein